MKYIDVRDEIPTFIPKKHKVKYVILGTMASACARNIDGKTEKGPFYYQSTRNNFWRILSHIFIEDFEKVIEISQREDFLERHGIAMANLVGLVKLPKNDARNPADTLLFDAFEDKLVKRLEFKRIDEDFKHLIRTKAVFFTCLAKPRLKNILIAYFKENQIDFPETIQFLPSPTRCSPKKRGDRWVELGFNPNN